MQRRSHAEQPRRPSDCRTPPPSRRQAAQRDGEPVRLAGGATSATHDFERAAAWRFPLIGHVAAPDSYALNGLESQPCAFPAARKGPHQIVAPSSGAKYLGCDAFSATLWDELALHRGRIGGIAWRRERPHAVADALLVAIVSRAGWRKRRLAVRAKPARAAATVEPIVEPVSSGSGPAGCGGNGCVVGTARGKLRQATHTGGGFGLLDLPGAVVCP